MPRLINTYIFKELAVPFFLSAGILTVTVLLSKVLKLVELSLNHEIGFSFIFWFLLSLTPPFLIYTIPASFLVSVLIACTRLSSDNEITAMKASGLSLFTLMRPVILWAFIAYAITLLLTLYFLPWGNHSQKQLLFDAARTKTTTGLEEKVFYDQFKDIVLYFDDISKGGQGGQGGQGELKGIFISQKEDEDSNIIIAERGFFRPSPEKLSVLLKVFDGEIHRQSEEDELYHIVKFSNYTIELDLKEVAPPARKHASTRELYTWELKKRIKETEAAGRPTHHLTIDLHKRFALPASVFVFAFLGMPLGMQRVRSARLTGFSVAVGVFIFYYVIIKSLEALGENGYMDPTLAIWAPNITLAALGLFILYRTAREKPLRLVPWLEGALHRFISKFSHQD
jgi:lipopolysaccharide export system permease protein